MYKLLFLTLILFACKTDQKHDSVKQKTFCIIKPNAILSGNAEDIILKIDEKYKVIKSKKIIFTSQAVDFLYYQIKDKPFFESQIIPALKNKQIIIMLIEGNNDVISGMRNLIGDKDPQKAQDGTIRKLYGKNLTENAIHCSDSYQSFVREVSFFFPEKLKDLVEIKQPAE